MAKETKNAAPNQADNAADSKKLIKNLNKESKNGILFVVLAFLTALVIMLAVIGGAYYIVIHNNVNGLAEKYRHNLQGNPILSWALPKAPDPEDPKYLTDEDLKNKYQELRKVRDNLTQQLDEANKKIAELQKYKSDSDKNNAEIDAVKKEYQAKQAQLDEQKKKLTEEKTKIDQMAAMGDKAGFREYFEKIDKENAQKIYAEIMKEQKVSDDTKKFIQLYETMEPTATAKIFEQMGDTKMDLIIEIMKNMKKDINAEILAAMDVKFASKITENLSKVYLKTTGQ